MLVLAMATTSPYQIPTVSLNHADEVAYFHSADNSRLIQPVNFATARRSKHAILTKPIHFSMPGPERHARGAHAPPLLFVLAAALLWSTGGLFIKWTSLAGLELSFCRSFFAAITVAIVTRHEGFGINRVTGAASVLYAISRFPARRVI